MSEPAATRCALCGKPLDRAEVGTCRGCLDRARTCLHAVYDLLALLPEETTERGGTSYDRARGERELPIPGGDALVMLSPGSDARQQTRDIIADFKRRGERKAASHADDELSNDPQSIPFLLMQWEDDWRLAFGDPGAMARGEDVTKQAHAYLLLNLVKASRQHPAFDEFVAMMRKARSQLAAITRTDMPRTKSQAKCLQDGCTGTLQRPFVEERNCEHRKPCTQCDHGGARDWWECETCHLTYTEAQHREALKAELIARRERYEAERAEAS